MFKGQNNGRHRSRLVILGYNQVPGVDFTDIQAPVLGEVVFRILLIIKLQMNWSGVIIDVEEAFLERRLDEKVWVKMTPGIKQLDA